MTENKETALEIRTGNHGLVLRSLDEMQRWAEGVRLSGLAPATLDTTAKILVATQYGLELGLTPMAALNSICVVRGKATVYGDAALAMVKKSGLLKEFSEKVTGDGDAMVATVVSVRKAGETVTTTFSVADAKTAKLWMKKGKSGGDTPWITHPKRMLKYKARAFNLRDNFPDVLMGLHLTEEMIGEVEEPLPAPECDTPPRQERRKKIESQTVTEESPPPTEQPAAPDTEEVTEDKGAAGTAFDTTEYDRVFKKYDLLGGTNFAEFAADILCMDEDELDSPEKFTAEMIKQLKRHLESEGV